MAVIKGFAVNNDGADKAGFTAPSVNGQAEVIRMAQEFGGTPADSISYVEAHGTGTPLGDPIEIAALTQAFRKGTDRRQFCGIGSVKSNIGHLDVAAGIAGLIKTVLALKHAKIPPTLHFEEPNPQIDFDESPFYVVDELTDWESSAGPRRAGVSSFGIGGTNAHVVLEEAPVRGRTQRDSRTRQLLVLSAKTATALDSATANLRASLENTPHADLADVAFTLQSGRREFGHRRAIVCRDAADAVAALDDRTGDRMMTGTTERGSTPTAFLFPGQGSQRAGAGRELYRSEKVFRETIDECADSLAPQLDLDLRDLLFPALGDERRAQELLVQTRFTQPALFALELALARLWMSWGVGPAAMIGHSVGEYVAACVAGVFSLEDGLRLIAARGRLIQAQPRGAMLAVLRPPAEVETKLGEALSMAAVNAPSLCVVSGPEDEINTLEAELEREEVSTRRLRTSHAFHSAMLEPALAPFAEVVKSVSLRAPQVPYISNVTADWAAEADVVDPNYWTRHLRHTVRFAEGADKLLQGGYAFLELGPGSTLTTLMRKQSHSTPGRTAAASLPAHKPSESEWDAVLEALGRLWLTGAPVDWERFQQGRDRRRVSLPTYPFERRRYSLEPGPPPRREEGPTEHRQGRHRRPGPAAGGRPPAAAHCAPHRADASRTSALRSALRDKLQELVGLSSGSFSDTTTFMELGLDSLTLAQFSRLVEKSFGVEVGPQQLGPKQASLATLSDYLAERLHASPAGSDENPLPPATAQLATASS